MKIKDFYCNELNWCSCGNPESVLEYMRDVLSAIHKRSRINHGCENTWIEDTESIKLILLLKQKEELGLSYMYMLDAIGLLEHGSSIYGSWLSPKGKKVLEMLRTQLADGCLSASDDT